MGRGGRAVRPVPRTLTRGRPLRIYWYWPFAREEDIGLAPAVLAPGDNLLVHAIRRPGAPAEGDRGGWSVLTDLPDVAAVPSRSPQWLANRAATYAERARRRRHALRSGRFDIAHLLFFNYFTDGLDPTLARVEVPVVASVHDVRPHQDRVPARLRDWLLARQYRRPDHLVVHHEWMRQDLAASFSIPPERIEVVPHFVSEVPEAGPPGPSGDTTILFFGTFRANKGIPTLLAAIAELSAEPALRFHFAGRGDQQIEKLVAQAAARDRRVTAEIGWVDPDRKHDLYRRASLVVLPYSQFGSQSGVLHDAYGHRVPVVVTDVGPLGRTVSEDGTGWVVPPNDPAMLAKVITEALEDQAGYSTARDATDRVARERRPANIGVALRSLYDRVLSGR